jgi:3'-5' exonuclease
VFIDTPAGVVAASRSIATATHLGLDTETKPVFSRADPRQPTSLLQIAALHADGIVSPRVFVFDLLALLPQHASCVDGALLAPLASPDTLVLGVDIDADIRGLCLSYPACNSFRKVHGVVDLGRVRGDSKRWSARRLASEFAGVTLSKSHQTSDWSRRPLRSNQLQYAAKDAR